MSEITDLISENTDLKEKLENANDWITDLRIEVDYLRSENERLTEDL